MIYFAYLKSVLIHKWFVFAAGMRVGNIPLWRLLVHDWQKFTPWEFGAYARKTANGFHNTNDEKIEADFAKAWLHHENTAPHHWGYWIPRSGKHSGKPLPMPETYVREMVADWLGAGRAYEGEWNISEWLRKSMPKILPQLHVDTLSEVCLLLETLGYPPEPFGYVFDGYYGRYVKKG